MASKLALLVKVRFVAVHQQTKQNENVLCDEPQIRVMKITKKMDTKCMRHPYCKDLRMIDSQLMVAGMICNTTYELYTMFSFVLGVIPIGCALVMENGEREREREREREKGDKCCIRYQKFFLSDTPLVSTLITKSIYMVD